MTVPPSPMYNLPSALRNLISIFMGDGAGKLITLGVFIYVAGILDVNEFGEWNVAAAFTGLFIPLVDGGLGFIGTRALARRPNDVPFMVTHIVLLRLVLAGCAFAVLVVSAYALGMRDHAVGLVIISGLALFIQAISLAWAYQGTGNTSWFAGERILQAVLYAVFVGIMFHDQASLLWLPTYWLVAASLTSALVLTRYALPRFTGIVRISIRAFVRNHWNSMAPVAVTAVMTQTHLVIDVLFAGMILGAVSAGEFSSGFRFFVVLLVIPNLLWSSFYPVLSRAAAHDRIWRPTVKTVMAFTWWASFLVAGIAVQFGRELFSFVYGDQYANVAWIFPWMLVAASVSFPAMVSTRVLPTRGYEGIMLKLSAVALTVHIVASCLLTYTSGIFGTTMGLLASEITLVILGISALKGFAGWETLRSGGLPFTVMVIAFGILATAASMMGLDWWISAALSTGVYCVWFVIANRSQREKLLGLEAKLSETIELAGVRQ